MTTTDGAITEQYPEALLCASSAVVTAPSGALFAPGLVSRWTRPNEVRDHVVGKAKSHALREDNKKYSWHRVLARNEGWML